MGCGINVEGLRIIPSSKVYVPALNEIKVSLRLFQLAIKTQYKLKKYIRTYLKLFYESER